MTKYYSALWGNISQQVEVCVLGQKQSLSWPCNICEAKTRVLPVCGTNFNPYKTKEFHTSHTTEGQNSSIPPHAQWRRHLRTVLSLFLDKETKQKWRDLPKAKATANITEVTGYLHLTRDFLLIHRKQNKWIPQGKPRSQFCRRELACFIWSQLTHDLIPFLSHLIKLFQTPDTEPISKTHQLHAPRPPSISKPAESLQNGCKVTRTYSNRNSSHGFFFTETAYSKPLTRQLKLEETWATSDQSGQETAKMGSFHGEHTAWLLRKHLVLGSLQHYKKGGMLPSEILRAELVQPQPCHCFRNRLWKQQPMRYPRNRSSVGD